MMVEHMGDIAVHPGDCIDILANLPVGSIDACVTDPPYHLTSIVKRFGKPGSTPAQFGRDGAYARASAGFMGKQWDGGDVAFRPETWAAVYRVLKPGAHLVAFGGTRTYHRLACAIEDADFEIRDMLSWLYGVGFPKSHNLDGDWQGWGTALKPACEPIVLARKPLDGTVAANVVKHGTGALNIDGCRIGTDAGWSYPNGRGGSPWHGREGLAKNLSEPMAAQSGRWPANVCHDGSEEVLTGFPETGVSSGGRIGNAGGGTVENIPTGKYKAGDPGFGDGGSAARFFYCAKADASERQGSKHPTVKPIALMRWLVRLVTPPGGTVLDLFAGTGTTGQACQNEGFSAILIEREPEYLADIKRRLAAGPLFSEAML